MLKALIIAFFFVAISAHQIAFAGSGMSYDFKRAAANCRWELDHMQEVSRYTGKPLKELIAFAHNATAMEAFRKTFTEDNKRGLGEYLILASWAEYGCTAVLRRFETLSQQTGCHLVPIFNAYEAKCPGAPLYSPTDSHPCLYYSQDAYETLSINANSF